MGDRISEVGYRIWEIGGLKVENAFGTGAGFDDFVGAEAVCRDLVFQSQ